MVYRYICHIFTIHVLQIYLQYIYNTWFTDIFTEIYSSVNYIFDITCKKRLDIT